MSTPQALKAAEAVFRFTHPPIRFTETPSYCEETIHRCADIIDTEMPQQGWQTMDSAPRDGTPFIWMHYIKVLTDPPTFNPYCDTLRRFWVGDERGLERKGDGFWMGQYGSKSDSAVMGGWWMPMHQPQGEITA